MGWVKLHRGIFDNAVWTATTAEQKVIFLTLVMMVNHYPNSWEWEGEKYHVKPGQTITSVKSICEAAGKGITPQKVKTALKKFEKYGILTNESTKRGRLISLLNWGKYQHEHEKLTNGLTDNQPTTNQQLTTKKECKNEIMKKEIIDSSNDDVKPKDIANYYYQLYTDYVGEQPLRNYSKDCSILKKSGVMDQDVDTIKGKLKNWFMSDEFAKDKNFPLPLFVNKYNEIPTDASKLNMKGVELLPGQLPNESDKDYNHRIDTTSPEEWKQWMEEWRPKYKDMLAKGQYRTFMTCPKCDEQYWKQYGHVCGEDSI